MYIAHALHALNFGAHIADAGLSLQDILKLETNKLKSVFEFRDFISNDPLTFWSTIYYTNRMLIEG